MFIEAIMYQMKTCFSLLSSTMPDFRIQLRFFTTEIIYQPLLLITLVLCMQFLAFRDNEFIKIHYMKVIGIQ